MFLASRRKSSRFEIIVFLVLPSALLFQRTNSPSAISLLFRDKKNMYFLQNIFYILLALSLIIYKCQEGYFLSRVEEHLIIAFCMLTMLNPKFSSIAKGQFVCLGLLLLRLLHWWCLKKLFFLLFQAKIETKALKAKRPGFTDDRYHETEYYVENGKHSNKYSIFTTAHSVWNPPKKVSFEFK